MKSHQLQYTCGPLESYIDDKLETCTLTLCHWRWERPNSNLTSLCTLN